MPGCFLDTSVWIAWYFSRHPHHALAAALLNEPNASAPAWLCRATEQSTFRLITTATICRAYCSPALTNAEAVTFQFE